MISIYPTLGAHASANRPFKSIYPQTFSQLAGFVTRYTWSPSNFTNETRREEFFSHAYVVGLDFDDGLKLCQAVDNVFAGMRHIIGTTRNHGKEKNGIVADRFRVILQFEHKISDLRTFKWNLDGLVKGYDSDKNARGGSRPFFPCTNIVSIEDGDLVEVEDPPDSYLDNTVKDAELEAFAKIGQMPLWLQHNLERSIAPGNRNNAVFGMAMDLSKIQASRDYVVEKLRQSRVYRENADDREFVRGMESTINSIFRKGRR